TNFTASATSGSATVSPTTTTTYTVTCTGTGGSSSSSATVTVTAQDILYSTDFSSGVLSPWVKALGTWTVSDGVMNGSSSSNNYSNVYYSANWTNYSVQGQIKFTSTSAYGGGIGGRVNATTGAHYGAWIYPDNSLGGSKVLKLIKFTSWTAWSGTPIKQISLPSVGTGWHTLKLVFQDSTIQVYYDGTLMINTTDTSYTSGGISADLWTYTSSFAMNVDNVTVAPITSVPSAPTATLSASPTSITSGGSSTITWSSTNATSCTGTNFTASATSGTATVSPTTTTTYTVTCIGAGGTVTKTATVTVSSNKFITGDRVQTTTSVTVRKSASSSSTRLGTQKSGAKGYIKGGPSTGSGYKWWNVNFDSGADGWVVENYLAKSIALISTKSDLAVIDTQTSISLRLQIQSLLAQVEVLKEKLKMQASLEGLFY
ncbi:MAG: hypothetical protein WCW87_03990, partial [Candidatus Paceibacterota bacterium]